ncbi:MAG: hypothetical protein HWE34_10880 [Methylocystaceae bacterium]|nr:hypothetical protein [Methylocystaceae bacterium]
MQRPGLTRERLTGLCLFGVLLFSPSLIAIFDRGGDTTLFGVPVLFVYVFGVWAGLVLVSAILIIRRQKEGLEPLVLEDD